MKDEQLPIGMTMIQGCRCRCGHEWRPHDLTQRPAVCPECKAANWDRPKRVMKVKKEHIRD